MSVEADRAASTRSPRTTAARLRGEPRRSRRGAAGRAGDRNLRRGPRRRAARCGGARRATMRTAEAVVEALVRRGIDPARLTPIGWGDEKPIDRNTTEDGRDHNRRVEFVQRGGCGCDGRPAGRADAPPAWDCR
ncbi:OmpA family protein [Nannocystis pusilla]|uniref:OmpA family protein n=1 Tax=Nannocystis pusilla TaxID=889268 RepID=UPI003B7B4359